MSRLIGPAPLLAGGFAVCRGHWRRALAVACERAAEPASWGPLEPTTVDTPSGRLCLRLAGRTGDARAIVFAHGVIVSGRYLLPIAAELAADAAVLVPDLPGFGLSAGSAGAPTLDGLADALIASATSSGYSRLVLVGNSFGAQIAARAAKRHPECVERLILIGPIDGRVDSLPRHYERWQRCALDEHLSILPVMARDLRDIGVRRAASLLKVMLRAHIETDLRAITAPTLVVRGGRDRVSPQAWVEHLASVAANGGLEVLPSYAHLPHWSGPLALAPVLRRYIFGGGPAPGTPNDDRQSVRA